MIWILTPTFSLVRGVFIGYLSFCLSKKKYLSFILTISKVKHNLILRTNVHRN